MVRKSFTSFLIWAALGCAQASADSSEAEYRLIGQVGPYVHHWSESDDRRTDLPNLVGLEWASRDRWGVGGSVFRNSFYQPSVYVYGVRRWYLPELSDWQVLPKNAYVKFTAGLIYGYKDEFEDKIPLNYRGLGVATLPALGYQFGKANVQAVFLWTAGVMFTFGYEFE